MAAQYLRRIDWTRSPLGLVDGWPPGLKSALALCLASRTPAGLWWGGSFIAFYNDALLKLLGLTEAPPGLGEPAHESADTVWQWFSEPVERAFANGHAYQVEDAAVFLDRTVPQEEIYLSVAITPIVTDGDVQGVFCSCNETTGRILQHQRATLLQRLGVEAAAARTVADASAAFARILGDYTGQIPFAAVYLHNEEERMAECASHTARPELQWTPPPRIQLPDAGASGAGFPEHSLGIPETEHAAVLPLLDAEPGLALGWLILGLSRHRPLDTEQREFVDALSRHLATHLAAARNHEAWRARADALAEADRVKTAFFANVSHEFRTPLTLMLGPLEEELRSRPAGVERLDIAFRNGLRLQKLVNSLLDFSRIEAGRMEVVFEPVDLATYTTELASVFRSAIESGGLAYTVDCPPLPEPAYVDRDLWEKIVLNLVSNAFKYTLRGGITVRLRAREHAAELTVIDSGAGIPASELRNVFKRFHRVRGTAARTEEGSGIGVGLVRELGRLHRGRIQVESEEGVGTTFTVTMPLGLVHLPKENVSVERAHEPTSISAAAFAEETARWVPRAQENPAAAANDPKPRVLVVDDNADMREYLQHLLRDGFQVTALPDGAAALRFIEEQPPDLVLADIMMPEIDGLSLLDAIRGNPRFQTMPVILISARAGEEARVCGLSNGADDYVTKPFSARELRARVATQVKLGALRRAAAESSRQHHERLEQQVSDQSSELERTYAALDRRNEQHRTFFHLAPAGLAELSFDQRFLSCNPEFCRLVGRTAETLAQARLSELVHPEDVEALRRAFSAVERTDAPVRLEQRYLRPNGELVWAHAELTPLGSSQDVPAVLLAVTDATAHHQAAAVSERRSRGLRWFTAASKELLEHDRPEELIPQLAEQLGALIGIDVLLHYRLEEHPLRLRLCSSRGLTAEQRERVRYLPVGQGVSGRAAQTRQVVLIQSAAPNTEVAAAELHQLEVATMVALPLLAEGQLLGTLALAHRQPTPFTDDDLVLIRAVADQIAGATQLRERLAQLQRDAKERQGAENARAETELRFRAVADLVPDLLWQCDGEGKATWYNHRWCEYTGQSFSEALNHSWRAAVHPQEHEAWLEKMAGILRSGKSGRAQVRLRRASDDEYRWFLVQLVPVAAQAGAVSHWFGAATDVHEQTLALTELRAAEERVQLAVAAARLTFWDWNVRAGTFSCDPSDGQLVGLGTPEANWGYEQWAACAEREDQPLLVGAIRASLATGEPVHVEFRSHRQEGPAAWTLLRGRVVPDAAGGFSRMVGIAMDISDRKAAERELQSRQARLVEALRRAEAAAAAKDQFLATLSHELRTPLTPILLVSANAARDPALAPAVRHAFEMVRKNVELEARLIDDLLDLTRITRGLITLDRREVDVHEVLHDAIEKARSALAEKQVDLQVALRASSTRAQADPARLQQIFWNILCNAVKFTPGGGRLVITSRLADSRDELIIQFQDTGIGMTASEIERLFDPFSQGEHVAQNPGSNGFGGLGLGLAIAQRLAELHGGRVTAASAGRGQGATLSVHLPLAGARGVAAGGPSAPATERPAAAAPVRVLLVEDHPSTRHALTQLLRLRRYQVTPAASAAEALERARESGYDILVSDLGLPDGDGYSLFADLRQIHPNLPGIALSGWGMDTDIERSKAAGFFRHLVKPIDVVKLDGAIADLWGAQRHGD